VSLFCIEGLDNFDTLLDLINRRLLLLFNRSPNLPTRPSPTFTEPFLLVPPELFHHLSLRVQKLLLFPLLDVPVVLDGLFIQLLLSVLHHFGAGDSALLPLLVVFLLLFSLLASDLGLKSGHLGVNFLFAQFGFGWTGGFSHYSQFFFEISIVAVLFDPFHCFFDSSLSEEESLLTYCLAEAHIHDVLNVLLVDHPTDRLALRLWNLLFVLFCSLTFGLRLLGSLSSKG
jgi:hypothetical protein